ncbi:nuclear transport factor 2 family protein [Propionibacterium ruminifibrarum]|uniref:nuclear transport factor 2 family protein n=1 Tax=Propionibacterium ruminifibrarum TaxID=1962131 RepID=UPI000E6AF6C9|nr:nuclear transport factor 2 family protein [Propionibacterium ruminifibrarum]
MNDPLSNQFFSILQFYGEHFARIDEGDIQGWAGDFADDAKFVSPTTDVTTAEKIFNVASKAHEMRSQQGLKNRHYQSGVHINASSDGRASVTSYVLVVMLDGSETQQRLLSTVVRDELVYKGRWTVQARRISFDGRQ